MITSLFLTSFTHPNESFWQGAITYTHMVTVQITSINCLYYKWKKLPQARQPWLAATDCGYEIGKKLLDFMLNKTRNHWVLS